jgi:AcrR family transcriptional regulator
MSRRPRVRLATDERRSQLVALGRSLFLHRPYDSISIDDIAEAAGVSKGLLYHYFDSKRRFYVETVRDAFREMAEVTEPDVRLPQKERLNASLDAYLAYIERSGGAYETLLSSGVGTDPEVREIIEAQRQLVMNRILAGLGLPEASPALRMAIRSWIGFIDAACLDWVHHRDVDRATIRALLSSSLESAIATAAQVDPSIEAAPPAPRAVATTDPSRAALAQLD